MKNFKRFILDEAAGKNVITVSGISDMKKADAERLSNVGENILSNLEDLGVANIFDKNIKYKGNLIIIDSDDEDIKLLEKWVKNQSKLAINTLKMIKKFPSGSDARVQYVKLYDNQKADHLYVAALLNNTAKPNKAPKYSHKFMKEEVELDEAPSWDHVVNDSPAGGFADPKVILKINALMGHILKEDQLDYEAVISKLRSSLVKLGLTFDAVTPFAEASGSIELPLTLNGGRFGKTSDTPHDEFLQDDGLSHIVEGGLKLVITYEKTEHNACKMRAKIV